MICLNALGLNFPTVAVLKGKDYRSESADGFQNGSLVNTTGSRWCSKDTFIIRVHHFQAYFQAYKAEGRFPFQMTMVPIRMCMLYSFMKKKQH